MRKILANWSVMRRGGGSYVSLEGLSAIGNMLFLCWFLGLAGCHHVDLLMRKTVDPVSAETFVTSIYLVATFPLGILLLPTSTGPPTTSEIVTCGVLLGVNSVLWGEIAAFFVRVTRTGCFAYAKREMFRPALFRVQRRSIEEYILLSRRYDV